MAWHEGSQYTRTYAVVWRLAHAVFHTLFPVRYEHRERLQGLEAPYLLVANHYSNLDALMVAVAQHEYQVSFLGKKELTQNRTFARFLARLHMIPVDRHHADLEAMRACTKLLRSGNVLAIFPEGTRHHEGLMTQTESGTALIALRAGVPLIPVWITRKPRLLRRTRLVIGEEIPYEDLRQEGINQETANALMQRIAHVYATMAEKAEK